MRRYFTAPDVWLILTVGMGIVLVVGGLMWQVSIVTIKSGMVGIVFQHQGEPDPSGRVVVEKGYKGIQREVLMPGLHLFWQPRQSLKITQVPVTEIPEGKVGMLIAKDGRDLPEHVALADDDRIDPNTGALLEMGHKGIRKTFLPPGRHPINTEYFQVQLHDVLLIASGKAGIVTRKIGEPTPSDQRCVPRGSPYRGIICEPMEPGSYYLHPAVYTWEIVDAVTIPEGQIGRVLALEVGVSEVSDASPERI